MIDALEKQVIQNSKSIQEEKSYKSYIKYGVIALAAVGAASAILDCDTAVAAQEMLSSEKIYGFLNGLRDGFLLPLNGFMTFFREGASWACDGNGIISKPNVWSYWVGYIITGGLEGTFFGSLYND